MKRNLSAISMTMMLVFGLVGPSAANPKGLSTIFLQGFAEVGKIKTDNNNPNDGCDSVFGGGLGLPVISQAKNAFWRFSAAQVVLSNAPGATTSLNICGNLGPVFDNAVYIPGNTKKGIGAACGISKGYNGKGVMRILAGGSGNKFNGAVIWLSDVGWKLDVSGLWFITGKIANDQTGIDKAKGKNAFDGFAGIVVAQGGQQCINKRDNPKFPFATGPKQDDNRGAVTFSIAGLLVTVPNGAFLGNRNELPGSPKGSNDMPLFCKKAKKDGEPCLYQTKK